MSYYPRGHGADDNDDFDEYDPTPYGGGYDQALTYGRPLPPSDEICYPASSSGGGDFDYDRPNYSSHAEPMAYAEEALENEYKSYARPGRPGPAPAYGSGGSVYQPNLPTPGYAQESEYGGSGHGRKNEYEYDAKPASGYGGGSEYGSGYGRKSEYESAESEYGSGYGKKNEYEGGGSEYGSGYGRKNEYESGGAEYGSGYGRKTEYQSGESEYGSDGRKTVHGSEYGSGYGKKSEYEQTGAEYGSGYGRKSGYDAPSSEYGSGYGKKTESEYGSGYGRSEYEKPSYGRTEESEGYGGSEYVRPGYGREEGYSKPQYGEEGHGRKKSDDDDSDEEKKHRHGRRHHHREDYDED